MLPLSIYPLKNRTIKEETAILIVKSSKKNLLTVPEKLLGKLGIRDGDRVDVKVKKGSISIVKESEDFLALEGALKDIDIETPIKELRKE